MGGSTGVVDDGIAVGVEEEGIDDDRALEWSQLLEQNPTLGEALGDVSRDCVNEAGGTSDGV